MTDPQEIAAAWKKACEGLVEPAAHFGPEWRTPRPRAADTYYLLLLESGDVEGDVALIWTQAPSPTTRSFGMALFPNARGRGLGPLVRDTAYELIFEDPVVHKLESEVYSSNSLSLEVLHRRFPKSKLEGIQRETIYINGTYYDRHLFGTTRDEWEAGL